MFKAIDDTCSFIQQKVDLQKHFRDSLNSLVKPEINIARKTIWDFYWTVVEIDSKILNYSNTTINYVSFDYILRKNDSEVYKIPCVVDLPIENKLQRDFIFDDEEHAQIYKCLESYGLPFYSADYQVKKIVFANGKKLGIDEDYYTDELYADKQYVSPQILKGECPYITDSDYLKILSVQLHANINALLNEVKPAMLPFFKWYLEP